MFGSVFFRASEIWPKALPDALPSFDVLVLETDWWRRLRLPAVNTGYSSPGLLARKVCEIFDNFF
jgi:hypothetical protein